MLHFSQHCWLLLSFFVSSVLVHSLSQTCLCLECVFAVWCLYLSLSGLMFSRLSSFKKLLLLACFERGCLWGCSLMSSYLTMDTSHEKLETNSEEKNKERTYRPLSGRRLRREERVLHLLFFVLLSWKPMVVRFMIQFQAMVGYQKSHFSIASFRLLFSLLDITYIIAWLLVLDIACFDNTHLQPLLSVFLAVAPLLYAKWAYALLLMFLMFLKKSMHNFMGFTGFRWMKYKLYP